MAAAWRTDVPCSRGTIPAGDPYPTLPCPHSTLTNGRATLRFYLGDCLDVLAGLPAASLDAIVTSPPYNLRVRYRSYDDTMPRQRYLEWAARWVERAARTLSPEGSFFLNVGAKPTDPWTALDVAQAVRPHLRLQNTIHWIKPIAIEKAAAGARAQLSDDQAVGVRYQDESNISRWRNAANGLRCRGNTWLIPYETIQNREKDRPHPATFPPKLPEMCLKLHGLSRLGTVADPFLGLGSTAVACAQLGLDFVGIEMDEAICRRPSSERAVR